MNHELAAVTEARAPQPEKRLRLRVASLQVSTLAAAVAFAATPAQAPAAATTHVVERASLHGQSARSSQPHGRGAHGRHVRVRRARLHARATLAVPTGLPSSPFDPFGSRLNFANAPLGDTTTLSTATVNGLPVNPAAGLEIQKQASTYGTYVNGVTYTTPLTVVPANQPLTPVVCAYGSTPCTSQMRQMMLGVSTTGADLHGGLPIPSDYEPAAASDTDAEAVFYQPDYVSPAGSRGRYYEAWKLRANPAFNSNRPVGPSNARWTAASGGRVVGTVDAPGHYRNWTSGGYRANQPGDPDSTYQQANWGVLASGLFIASDEVRRADCSAGRIDHAVGLMVHAARPGYVWPAQRSDGTLSTSSIVEGMRLRLPAGTAKPAFSNRLASMLFDAAERYGLVVDDLTHASVGIRLEPASNGHGAPDCLALLDRAHGYDALAAFPWSKLRVMATGSDAAPNPAA